MSHEFHKERTGWRTISWIIMLIGVSLVSPMEAKAQDPGFSQFFASPLTLNPALTGKFNGVLRVAGNYRNQWPTIDNAFVTSTISLDAPILVNRLPDNDTWGIGMLAMTDRTASGLLNRNFLSFSTAYHKSLDDDGLHSIGVGFQGAYTNMNLDGTKLHFEDGFQLNGTWLQSPSEAINYQTVNTHYFDMNLGALYNASTNGNNNYYVGVSGYHLNKPRASFYGVDTVTVPVRLTVHGGGYFPITGTTSTIYISGQYNRQGFAYAYVAGGAWEVNVGGDEINQSNVYFGLWGRFTNQTDALIPYVGMDYGSFNLGLSYDVNVSLLKTGSQNQGGIELSLIYIKKRSDGKHGVPCPRF